VWQAITDSRLLAQWLMENNFQARVGWRFVLRRADSSPAWRGWVECEVLLQKPTRMVWSWSDGAHESEPSRVIFELRAAGEGTRLTLRHVGDERNETAKLVCERWPIKLRALTSICGGQH
jgi:uncharacterized protein YndB with AHSA1/START domain